MKTFVDHEREWETVGDFLQDAFELVYDIDPLVEILVMKGIAVSGHQMKMFVDGDLMCSILFYDPDGNQVNSISWQGTSRVEHIRMEDFQKELQEVLNSFGEQKQTWISF